LVPFPLISHQGLAAPALLVGRRRRLDPVAFLIGTLAPDLPYAVDRSRFDFDALSHTLAGVALWAVPMSVAAAWVFRRYMAEPLALVLPDGGPLRLRDVGAAARRWPGWWTMAVAAALGALTHLAFDGFVHPEDWAVDLVPALVDSAPVSLPNHPARPTYWYDVVHAVADGLGVALAAACFGLSAWRRARSAEPRAVVPSPTAGPRRLMLATVIAGAVVGLVAAARVWWIETMAQATMLFTWSVALGLLGGCLLVRRYPATAMDAADADTTDTADTTNADPAGSAEAVEADDVETADLGGTPAVSLVGWDIGTFDDLDWSPWGGDGKARAKILGSADGYMVTLVEAEPGYEGTPHEHSSAEFFYLVDGEVRNQGRTMRKGDGYAAAAGTFHADFATDTGATYIVIFKL
jgi:hypothetical protein